MSKPQILVFGSTGKIGFEVCKALAKRGVPFRAVIHSPEKADSVKKLGNNIETVQVDITQLESVSKALEGITQVFLMTPPMRTSIGFGIVDEIKKAGTIKNIVKLSALAGAHDFPWSTEHREVEEYAKKQGLTVTSLRPTSFHTNTLLEIPTIKSQSTVYKAYGDARMNYTSNKDIGEVAAKVLTEPGHEGKSYNLTGPDTLNTNEYAKIISQVIGKEVKYVPISDEQLRKQAANFLPNAQMVEEFSQMHTFFRNGGYDKHYSDLEELIGNKGVTFQSFIEENKQAFL